VPATPLATKYIGWIIDAFRAIGVNPNLGEQVASLLGEAGLTVEGAASANAGRPADSVMPQYVADTFRSVLPAVLAHCGVTEAEAGVDTLRERLARECKEADATLWMPELVASWARVPAGRCHRRLCVDSNVVNCPADVPIQRARAIAETGEDES
jgi:hypothetical protein